MLDREFSYLELLENLVAEGVNFVIRLILGPNFFDGEGQPVVLSVAKGETRILNKVFYKGKVFVNVIGVWQKGFSNRMWVMTNLNAEEGLAIYLQRMKIESVFRDLKSLFNFHKLMNKRRSLMEKMVARNSPSAMTASTSSESGQASRVHKRLRKTLDLGSTLSIWRRNVS